MDKTVIVLAGNSLSSVECGPGVSFDISQSSRGSKSSAHKTLTKTVWSCCVEAVLEYCRTVFDLFPDQYQVCVAAVDEAKCQPINSWRDEDQEITKVQSGFQKFGLPTFVQTQAGRGHLAPCLQGLQYAVRCLAQLTATQYAVTSHPGLPPPSNQGRIIFLCSLKSEADVGEMEKAVAGMVKAENNDIKLKHDVARLPIDHCQLTLVNVYSSSLQNHVKDQPLAQLSSVVSVVGYSFPGKQVLSKILHLVKLHYNLRSTIVTGIPMKEEQSGGNSANYDVELIHLAEAHRDILRASYGLGGNSGSRKDSNRDVVLRWSTPKSTSLELQHCTSAYRVTPTDVTSRPTICLINFVLSGKAVLLEQPKKNSSKVISHLLTSHAGVIHLHCIPPTRPYLDDPPSISEGWGGRVTDYRISDFSELVREHSLTPVTLDRTKIPDHFPEQKALAKLERTTRHWPMVFTDTLVYTLTQELDCLPSVVKQSVMSEQQLEQCKQVIIGLYNMEQSNQQLSIPNAGRSKGSRREEQYRALWVELENLIQAYSSNSERHVLLLDFLVQTSSRCPSMQLPRKTPPLKTENGAKDPPSRRDQDTLPHNGQEFKWSKQHVSDGPKPMSLIRGAPPSLSKPIGSLLSIWTSQKQALSDRGHVEFAGRGYNEGRAELYKSLRTNNVMPDDLDL